MFMNEYFLVLEFHICLNIYLTQKWTVTVQTLERSGLFCSWAKTLEYASPPDMRTITDLAFLKRSLKLIYLDWLSMSIIFVYFM